MQAFTLISERRTGSMIDRIEGLALEEGVLVRTQVLTVVPEPATVVSPPASMPNGGKLRHGKQHGKPIPAQRAEAAPPTVHCVGVSICYVPGAQLVPADDGMRLITNTHGIGLRAHMAGLTMAPRAR